MTAATDGAGGKAVFIANTSANAVALPDFFEGRPARARVVDADHDFAEVDAPRSIGGQSVLLLTVPPQCEPTGAEVTISIKKKIMWQSLGWRRRIFIDEMLNFPAARHFRSTWLHGEQSSDQPINRPTDHVRICHFLRVRLVKLVTPRATHGRLTC